MRKLLIIVIALIVLGVLYLSFDKPAGEARRNYENEEYGFSFSYPKGYKLDQRNADDGNLSITLIREEDSDIPENGEGPTSINVNVYEKTSASQSLLDWIREDKRSNFDLSSGSYQTTEVDGQTAVDYKWDGLYPGRTVAFEDGSRIIAISGTYMDPADQIRTDFDKVVESFDLSD